MPYGPHTADDRARMLATIGVASVDDLFEDIPARSARARCGSTRRSPSSSWRPGCQASPARNRVDLASLPRRRRVPPLDAAGRRPAAAPRRVVHGLHAVPARGQPGHAPEHLRVPVAARRADRARRRVGVALRRRRGDGRGRADDLPGDAPRPDPRLARPSTRTTAQTLATYVDGRRARGRRDPAGRGRRRRRHDRPRGARAAARRCRPAGRRAWSRPSPTSSACSRTCPRSGGSPTRRARCS